MIKHTKRKKNDNDQSIVCKHTCGRDIESRTSQRIVSFTRDYTQIRKVEVYFTISRKNKRKREREE